MTVSPTVKRGCRLNGQLVPCSPRLSQVDFDYCRDARKDDNHEQYNPNEIRVHLEYLPLFKGKFGRNMFIAYCQPNRDL